MKLIINNENLSKDLQNYNRVTIPDLHFGMEDDDFLLTFGFRTQFSGEISKVNGNVYRFSITKYHASIDGIVTSSLLEENVPIDRALYKDALKSDFKVSDYIIVTS